MAALISTITTRALSYVTQDDISIMGTNILIADVTAEITDRLHDIAANISLFAPLLVSKYN
jgi:hypothetical protein